MTRDLSVKGRLAPGVTRAQAEAELAAIAKSLEKTYPDTNRDQGVVVKTEFQTRLQDDPADAALVAMLLALAGLVLVVACANLANLLLSRARSRTREIAIRLAVGAGRLRVIRQLLAESLAIALAGGVVSLLFAYGGAAFLSRIQVPSDLPHCDRRQSRSARPAVQPGDLSGQRRAVRPGPGAADQPDGIGAGPEGRRRR